MFAKRLFLTSALLLSISCQSLKGGEGSRRQSLFGGLSQNRPEVISQNQNQNANSFLSVERPQNQLNNTAAMQTQSPLELKNVDENIWRSSVDATALFNMISRILAQRYVISAVDRRNLTASTEWDKFFIEGRMFRNRLSVSVFPVGMHQSEVVLKNSVEYYSGTPGKLDSSTVVNWYPTPDITDEVQRLVSSLNRQIASSAPFLMTR